MCEEGGVPVRLLIYPDYETVSNKAANHVCEAINSYGNKSRPFVLGLPAGSTPLGTYKELIRRYKDRSVSFKNVITINMNEYVDIPEKNPQSYRSYMYETFFKHIDILEKNTHIPSGNARNLEKESANYEAMITDLGGVDLFMAGVGRDGHIAFNMAGSSLSSRTHVQKLNKQTIEANSRFFGNDLSRVPTRAITVGMGTIMDARQVLLVVSGQDKAEAMKHGVEGAITHMWTITALQMHPNAVVMCDESAASALNPETLEMFRFLES